MTTTRHARLDTIAKRTRHRRHLSIIHQLPDEDVDASIARVQAEGRLLPEFGCMVIPAALSLSEWERSAITTQDQIFERYRPKIAPASPASPRLRPSLFPEIPSENDRAGLARAARKLGLKPNRAESARDFRLRLIAVCVTRKAST